MPNFQRRSKVPVPNLAGQCAIYRRCGARCPDLDLSCSPHRLIYDARMLKSYYRQLVRSRKSHSSVGLLCRYRGVDWPDDSFIEVANFSFCCVNEVGRVRLGFLNSGPL